MGQGRRTRNDGLLDAIVIVIVLLYLAWTYRDIIIAWIVQAVKNFLISLIIGLINALPPLIVIGLGVGLCLKMIDDYYWSKDHVLIVSLAILLLSPLLPAILIFNYYINSYIVLLSIGMLFGVFYKYYEDSQGFTGYG